MIEIIKPKPSELHHTECEACGTQLTFNDTDVEYGDYGCGYIKCPVCGEKIFQDGFSEEITFENIEYPRHFSDYSNGVDQSDLYIQSEVRRGIKYMDENPAADYWMSSTGKMLIVMLRSTDSLDIFVTRNYQECDIYYED